MVAVTIFRGFSNLSPALLELALDCGHFRVEIVPSSMNQPSQSQYFAQLQAAIQHLHGCKSEHLESVRVKEEFRGRIVWEGQVEVFRVSEHPKAEVCYAWAYKDKRSNTDRIAAILGLRLIPSAVEAVRTFIMTENRQHIA